MKQVLDRAQLRVPAGQRRLQAVHPLRPAYRRQHPGGLPQLMRLGLAFQPVQPGIGKPDRTSGQPACRRIYQHRPGSGSRLHPSRSVHRIPRHHALADCAQADRDLASYHSRACGQSRRLGLCPEFGHRGYQIQPGPHRPFRISLSCRRCSPDRHHCIADELLHRPAVPADHLSRNREVTGQQLTDRLRIPRLRQRGEPHHVTKQHRAHPPLRYRRGRPRTDRG